MFIVLQSVILEGDHGDPQYDRLLTEDTVDPKTLRDLILKATASGSPKLASKEILTELTALKENVLKSSPSHALSGSLTDLLKDSLTKALDLRAASPILGIAASEAVADPNINVIDKHVVQIINTSSPIEQAFHPDPDEMKTIAKQKHRESKLHNLYRENLRIESISEESKFTLGSDVEQWKVLTLNFDETALIGRTSSSIVLAVGRNDSYQLIKTLTFDVPSSSSLHFEVLKVFDSNLNRARNLVLVALQGQLIWHELVENNLVEIHRWNLLKEIGSMLHFTHDGSEILLLSTIDESGKVQAEFIEFNVPDSEFWVIQAFPLPIRSPSMACLDLGRDFIVAFVQDNFVSIYRHQFTKHLRGKFSHFQTIVAANVSTVSGFRIGGHSYLAVGGNEPQILRY